MRLKIPGPVGRPSSTLGCPTNDEPTQVTVKTRRKLLPRGYRSFADLRADLANNGQLSRKATNHRPTGVPVGRGDDGRLQVDVVCEHCTKAVRRKLRNGQPPQRYCSVSCAASAAKALGKFRGASSPAWRGGISAKAYRYTGAYKRANPEKARAHKAVRYAVRKGHLVRLACEMCGDHRTHAHHDDYSKPLDVRWLCRPHHHEWHRLNDRPMGPRKGRR